MQARRHHFAFTIDRRGTEPLQERIWAIRHQFTAYDAAYIARAEALTAPLLTCDRKLAGGTHRAQVITFPRTH